MELKDSDLVIDEYGNYYSPVEFFYNKGEKMVLLSNSFMKYSMERLFHFDEIQEMQKEFGEYNRKPFGIIALNKLKNWVSLRQEGKLTSHIYTLKNVMEFYIVKFKQLDEY